MIDLGALQSALIGLRPQQPQATQLENPGKGGKNIAQPQQPLNPDITPHWYYKVAGMERGSPEVAQPIIKKSMQP